jgi:hypothetical protein
MWKDYTVPSDAGLLEQKGTRMPHGKIKNPSTRKTRFLRENGFLGWFTE